MRILNIGYSTCALAHAAFENGAKETIYGDISAFMLKESVGKEGSKTIDYSFCQLDAEALPYKEDSFDAVISGMPLGSLANHKLAVEEMVVVRYGYTFFSASPTEGITCLPQKTDWKSGAENMAEPNKDNWKNEKVIDYDCEQRFLVPQKDKMLNTIVDFIPFPPNDPIHVLDIGTGQGALSEKILNVFSKTTVTLFDYSNEMLAVAEQRLACFNDRVTTAICDFNALDWPVHTNGLFDAIVSALVLHYLKAECRAPFFKNAYSELKVPGCFVNAGVFAPRSSFIQYRFRQRMFEHT